MINKVFAGRNTAVNRVISLVLAVCCIFALCACAESSSGDSRETNGNQRKKQVNIHRSITEMLGFDIDSDYFDAAEITNDNLASDSYGKIKIQVKQGKEDELLNLLQDKLGKPQAVQPANIPRYQEHQYASELRQMQNIRYFAAFKSGATAKSVPIDLYLAKMNLVTFLYIFG